MAKVLVACDEYIYSYNNNFYAASQEKYELFQRYLRVFEEMRLVVRCIKETELKEERVLLNDDRIEIIDLPIFHGPREYLRRYIEVGKKLTNITLGCNAAVLRLPSTIALRVAQKVIASKIPYVTEVVFDAWDGMKGARGFVEKILWHKIDKDTRSICYQANGVACVTEEYLQKRYFSKLENSFTSHYSSLALENSFYLSERQYPNKAVFNIAHVSIHIQNKGRKGHNELIKAISLLKEKGVVVHVYFAGHDYNNGICKLKKLAQDINVYDQIHFVGFLSRTKLRQLLLDSDILVFPTKAEGLPRVLIEGMATGLPCISTNVSGNYELLSPEYLISYDSPETLSLKIQSLINNRNEYETQSKINFKRSLEYKNSILQERRDSFYLKLKQILK